MFKVIVAGSRSLTDHLLVTDKLDKLFENKDLKDIEIVSGNAPGADRLGEDYAKNRKCDLTIMPASWSKYGKSAGYRRNEKMAKYADACVVFWDGGSPGSKHMIETAKKAGIPTRVVKFSPEQATRYRITSVKGG